MKPLFPPVKKRTDYPGIYQILSTLSVCLPDSLSKLQMSLDKFTVIQYKDTVPADIVFEFTAKLNPQGYVLSINEKGIEVKYSDYSGAFYAFVTIQQLYNSTLKAFPYILVEDWPDLSIRGLLMDISRDKIPTLSTIKAILDKMATLKMNHFELYVEGFSYEYPSFDGINESENSLTLSDYLELESYANQLAIDFVGNMNGFGHMTKWLELPDFHHLAECSHGFWHWGYHFPASTLNPLNPQSEQLVVKMYQDMLPHLKSTLFNINCDEPFELGRGKSKKAVRKYGLENVYVDFVSKLVTQVNKYDKTALVWGDVLIHHPEVLTKLPPKMIFLDWGYDRGYPFDNHMQMLANMKVNFIGCPGTSSWNSFSGRKNDMMETTKNAADNAKKYGGLGIITTDWGDFGHLQYLPFSYPGIIYAGLVSWGDSDFANTLIEPVLSSWLGQKELAKAILDLSDYSKLENKYVDNGTLAFSSIMFVDPALKHPIFVKRFVLQKALHKNRLSFESGKDIHRLLNNVIHSLKTLVPNNEEQTIVYDEIMQTIENIKIAVDVNLVINRDLLSDCPTLVNQIIVGLESTIIEHQRLWNIRNKPNGLDRSLSRLVSLKAIIQSLRKA